MLLSDKRIMTEMDADRIVISPFNELSLGTNGYDVRLAPWYFAPSDDRNAGEIFDMADEMQARLYWGPEQLAKPWGRYASAIIVKPGQTILARTIETIGGKDGITSSMRARSSTVRMPLSVCKCGGLGDVGYIAPWTMEITNHGQASFVIPVGLRIAQITFYEVGETLAPYQDHSGNYGKAEADWTPDDMLPKSLWRDRDAADLRSGYWHQYAIEHHAAAAMPL